MAKSGTVAAPGRCYADAGQAWVGILAARRQGVSVALATFNGAGFIDAQLDSLARQTLTPAELVVCDDQSADDTIDRVRRFAATAPFSVRVEVNRRRLGFSDNFLKAAGLCSGDHVAFCDQDDVWLPAKLSVCLNRLTTDGSCLALHRSTMTDADLMPYDILSQGIVSDAVHQPFGIDPYITGWGNTMVFASDLLHRVPAAWRPQQPEDPSRPLSHDTWIYTLAAALGRVSHIMEPLLLYRQHGRNAQGAGSQSPRQRLVAALTVPVGRFAARRDFDRAMVEIFARRSGDPAMAKAAELYGRRCDAQTARLSGYTSRSPVARLKAFRRYYALSAHDPAYRPAVSSRLKDALLGVAGLGRMA